MKTFLTIARKTSVIVIGVLFMIAGVNHFLDPNFYMKMMPSYLPAHLTLVYLSGFFEVLGGAGFLINRLRRLAGFGLIALLIAVFPANVDMLIHSQNFPSIPFWALVARLPFQFVLIAWVWWAMDTNKDK